MFNLQQVLAFREQKLEALKLQAAIAAKQQEEEEEQLRAAEERERKLRDKKHRYDEAGLEILNKYYFSINRLILASPTCI